MRCKVTRRATTGKIGCGGVTTGKIYVYIALMLKSKLPPETWYICTCHGLRLRMKVSTSRYHYLQCYNLCQQPQFPFHRHLSPNYSLVKSYSNCMMRIVTRVSIFSNCAVCVSVGVDSARVNHIGNLRLPFYP